MSLVRLIIIKQYISSRDASWDYVPITNWNSIEINSAIVVSCIIVLKPLMRRLVPSLFTASDQGPMPDRACVETRTRTRGLSPRWLTTLEASRDTTKQLTGGDTSVADLESQASIGGRMGHIPREDQRAAEA